MLWSLPRARRIVEISYGCIGRSFREPSTANASGFATLRFAMSGLLDIEYSNPSIRCEIQAVKGLLVERRRSGGRTAAGRRLKRARGGDERSATLEVQASTRL